MTQPRSADVSELLAVVIAAMPVPARAASLHGWSGSDLDGITAPAIARSRLLFKRLNSLRRWNLEGFHLRRSGSNGQAIAMQARKPQRETSQHRAEAKRAEKAE